MTEAKNIPQGIVTEDKICPNGCKKNDEVLFYAMDRFHDLKGNYPLVKCKTCGLIRTNPRPALATLSYYYPDNYGPYQGTIINSPSEKKAVLNKLKKIIQKITNTKSTAIPDMKPGKMLEIGCASGQFLHEMAHKGWEVCGIEFSDSSAENARQKGYKVFTGAFENAPDDYKNMDLVAMWMVLEHLSDPVNSLQKISSYMKQDAWLCFSVPNTDSYLFKTFKENYYDIHVPNHLYHYGTATLKDFLKNNGFEVKKIQHQRLINNLTGSLALKILQKNPASRLGKYLLNINDKILLLLFPVSYLLSIFGQTGRMTIWAKKIS